MRFPAMRVFIPVLVLVAGCATTPSPDVPATAIARFSTNSRPRRVAAGVAAMDHQPDQDADRIPAGARPADRCGRAACTRRCGCKRPASAAGRRFRHSCRLCAGAGAFVDLIVGADNQDRYAEDSPVRLMLFFDGDKKHAAVQGAGADGDREAADGAGPAVRDADVHLGEPLTGRHDAAEHFTSQVKMIVAGSGPDRSARTVEGLRTQLRRGLSARFGAPPGRLIGVGIMTDTDNTGERIDAYYGDIELKRAP